MRKLKTLKASDIVLAIGLMSLVVVGVGVFGYPLFHVMSHQNRAEAVLTNAATLQLAAESFASTHQGEYATTAVELLPYLPENSAPVNPYTADKILFQAGIGDMTYQSVGNGQNYVIEAYGKGRGLRPQLLRTLVGRGSHKD